MVSANQQILHPILQEKQIELFIKREDLLHPFVSGNKYRKLKYNIAQAKKRHAKQLITFGGAYSNHIAAVAAAAKLSGFTSLGIIRGQEIATKIQDNPTLCFAQENGMRFSFISREAYREKNSPAFIAQLQNTYPDAFIIPEGGTNGFAIQGCQEILQAQDAVFDIITTPVGTGGTLAGLANSAFSGQEVLGFPALKGDFIIPMLQALTTKTNWSVIPEYHFGGYAKTPASLIAFINAFKAQTGLLLDPLYTAKMIYGILDMVSKNKFKKNTKILAIHTGGLQAISGINQRLTQKKLPTIHV